MNIVDGPGDLTDSGMSLRAWARSRGIPASTAHKAVKAGRITRRPDGRLDPVQADREWVQNTRPRVDGRAPSVPPDPDAGWVWLPDVLAALQEWDATVGGALDRMLDRLAPGLAAAQAEDEVRRVLVEGITGAFEEALAEF